MFVGVAVAHPPSSEPPEEIDATADSLSTTVVGLSGRGRLAGEKPGDWKDARVYVDSERPVPRRWASERSTACDGRTGAAERASLVVGKKSLGETGVV